MVVPLSLEQLNAASATDAAALLAGTYEHSPWVVEAALRSRPCARLGASARSPSCALTPNWPAKRWSAKR